MAGEFQKGVTSAPTDLIGRTVDVVAAYVSRNALSPDDLPQMVAKVHRALRSLVSADAEAVDAVPALAPAVPIKKSITPDFLICLEDGKKFKSLKRHLRQLGMTPEQYRDKWGLRPDYPMVAPNYSATRSKLARSIGLGRTAGLDKTAKRTRKAR